MKLTTLLLCAFLVLTAAACTESVAPTNSPAPIAGAPKVPAATPADPIAVARVNYAKNCEACHGPGGEGGVVKVDGKEIKIPSLKAEHAIKKTDDRIVKMITDGEEAMPAFKDKMSAAEITELVKFVRKEFQGK
jgi:menaquinol-cytochrome c reductase cytochrome b/c subunit